MISEKFSFIKFSYFLISNKYFPDNAPSGQINNVFLPFSASLYLINFFIRSNVSLSDKLYFSSKFGDTILISINFFFLNIFEFQFYYYLLNNFHINS